MRDEGWLECRRCERRFHWADTAIHEDSKPPLKDLSIVDFRNIQVVPVEQPLQFQWVSISF
ncbi:hypothetical protein BDZ97DRAFT_1803810 [Flammula alnicola]|nr:hypothetical protein BDZ97DRAFT_1803810 [Flammula alnicola]